MGSKLNILLGDEGQTDWMMNALRREALKAERKSGAPGVFLGLPWQDAMRVLPVVPELFWGRRSRS